MKKVLVMVCALGLALALAPAANAALATTWLRNVGASARDIAVGRNGAVYVVGQGPAGAQPFEGRTPR